MTRLLGSPRLVADIFDKSALKCVTCLANHLLYHVGQDVYAIECDKGPKQEARLLDEKIVSVHFVSENFAVFVALDGSVRIFVNSSGYCTDIFWLELSLNSEKKETDPIHDVLISSSVEAKILCVANIDALYVLEVDFDLSTGNSPKLLSSAKLAIELDADIESGVIWGGYDSTYLVYRSCSSIFSYGIARGDAISLSSAAEYHTDHGSYISALSSGVQKIGVSCDICGTIIVWNVSDNKLDYLFSNRTLFSTEVTYITGVYDSSFLTFWVCDINGRVCVLDVDVKNKSITKRFELFCGSFGCYNPTHMMISYGECMYKLRVSSKVIGNSIEFNVDDKINVIFNCSERVSYEQGHKCVVTCASINNESNLLIVATWDGCIKIWRYQSGELLQSFQADPGSTITSIASAQSTKSECKFAFGCTNGCFKEYSFRIRTGDPIAQSEQLSLEVFHLMEGEEVTTAEGKEVRETERKEISPSKICEHNYSTLPVTDILYSSKAQYSAICFARNLIVVHSSSSNSPLSQINVEGFISSVSTLQKFENVENATNDSHAVDDLMLVLQGTRVIRVLDALNREYVFTLDSFPMETRVISCRLWLQEESNKIGGLYYTEDFSMHELEFTIERGVESRILLSSPSSSELTSKPSAFSSMNILHEEGSSLVVNWNSRFISALVYEMNSLSFSSPHFSEFLVTDDRCRIVRCFGINIASRAVRATRIVIVVSDGTVYYVDK